VPKPAHEQEGCCEKFIHAVNEFDMDQHRPVSELIVWGGVVANCGEHTLSKIAFENAHILRSLVYCPDRTKGGALIRPGYFRGDRGFKMEFPKLTDMSIRLSPALLPEEYGWITPELRRLRLLCVIPALQRSRDDSGRGSPDFRLPGFKSVNKWLSVNTQNALSCALFTACPKLESITLVLCSTADSTCSQTDWIELLPPKPLPWNIQRLLLLPVLKPVEHIKDAGDARTCDRSPLSSLVPNITQMIFAFLGRPRWQYKDHAVPMSTMGELGLPDGFCRGINAKTIVDGTCREGEFFPDTFREGF